VSWHHRRLSAALLACALLAATGCSSAAHRDSGPSPAASIADTSVVPATTTPPTVATTGVAAGAVPHWEHVVVVVLENRAAGELVGDPAAPFLTRMAADGMQLASSYAITHPSEPNYLALFSGSTHGLTSDACPVQLTGPNLATALLTAGRTFTGFSESLPNAGYTGCSSGAYARKHNPWVDFAALPASVNQPMTAFPTDPSRLPDLAFVIPNLDDDMHDGTIAQADQWLSVHLSGYLRWAMTHDSALLVTTDEDDSTAGNHITTLVAGAHVPTGTFRARVNHYGVLRTLLDAFGLPAFSGAVGAVAITGVWS
jgi:acid phosphatase